jgi:hypothetical protein
MSTTRLALAAVVPMMVAGCGGGGLNFWLYPEPHLAEAEESVFVAHEDHGLQSIDGEETAIRCWGRRNEPQAYRQRGQLCRLHIRPGEHSVVFYSGVSSQERVTLSFTALPGRAYGLDRSQCTSTAEGHRQTCRVEVVEVDRPTEGG